MIQLSGTGSAVTALAFAPDHPALAAGTGDGHVRFWTTLDDCQPQVVPFHDWRSTPVTHLRFWPDSDHLLVTSQDAYASGCCSVLLRVPHLKEANLIWGNAEYNVLVPSPDESVWATMTTRRLSLRESRPPFLEQWIDPSLFSVNRFAIDPTSARLAVLYRDAKPWPHQETQPVELTFRIRLWNLATQAVISNGEKLIARHMAIQSQSPLAFSRDGSRFVYGHEREVRLADSESGRTLRVAEPPSRESIAAVAFHPTTDQLTLALSDGSVVVLDTDSWSPAQRFDWQIGPLTALAYRPDGTMAAVGGRDGRVMVWDVE
jgi:WD40 repeat protein